MTIESGQYCQYCVDEGGKLFAFDEIFERFVQFAMRKDAELPRETAEKQTLEFMGTMPAWQEHQDLARAKAARSA